MKRQVVLIVTGLCACVALLSAGLSGPAPLPFPVPRGWPEPNKAIFEKNVLTEEGFQLGRRLFYDPQLSSDGMVSCGNCHQQFAAFATLDHPQSHGVGSELTTRNAPSLANLAWMQSYHWDGGVHHIEVQPLTPFTLHNEMNETLPGIVKKVQQDTAYAPLFEAAFGSKKVTIPRIARALAQFTCSLVSSQSRYDRVMNGTEKFTETEAAGYALFKQHCNSCHTEPLFTNGEFRNNGMPLNETGDAGRMGISGHVADSLSFKVPTLRNVQVSFPYMHDGSLGYLPNVIAHYAALDTALPGLDARLRRPIILSGKEQRQLLYFLYTLTDSSFLSNPRFAPPRALTYKH